jgi:hypothetical protein
MSKWSQTKGKWKLTSLSTTFMKTSRLNSKSWFFLSVKRVHDRVDPCVIFWSLSETKWSEIELWMPKWGETKANWKLTYISITFMKTPKFYPEHKVVKKMVFLRLGKVHGRASQSARPCVFKHKRRNWEEKNTRSLRLTCTIVRFTQSIQKSQFSMILSWLTFLNFVFRP